MIFRVKNNRLYKVEIKKELEDIFLQNQQGGSVKFIKVTEDELPEIEPHLPKFYKYDENKKIVPDMDRIKKEYAKVLKEKVSRYIFTYYPQEKQNSDLADKLYYENILKAKGVSKIEKGINNRVIDFYNGKTIEETIKNISDENKEAYRQLVKVGIRVAWVQMCKDAYKEAIANLSKINLPKYPL